MVMKMMETERGIPRRWEQRIWRWLRPRTPWIALLGVDGSGKSTVLVNLAAAVPRPYTGLVVLHRRPQLLYRSAAAAPGPIQHYAKPPHPPLLSTLKLGAIALDWLAGYLWHIRGRQAEGVLVVADRHALLDLLAAPLRYRYGGPQGLIRGLLRLLPMPDMVLLLDAPVAVLQTRKTELTAENAAALRYAYLQLIKQIPASAVIDASQPLSQVIAEITHLLTAAHPASHSS